MHYIPGNIHTKLQEQKLLVLLNDFIFCILKDRYDNTDLMDDSEIIPLPLNKGDVIFLRLFRPFKSPYSSELYCYVDKVFINGVERVIDAESLISKDFLDRNQRNEVLFREINLEELRELKLNQILTNK